MRNKLTIFLCESTRLEERNFTLSVEIFFVADKDDDDVWTGERPRIHQPVCQRDERLTASNVIKLLQL